MLKGEQAMSRCERLEAILYLIVWLIKNGFGSSFVFLRNGLTLPSIVQWLCLC